MLIYLYNNYLFFFFFLQYSVTNCRLPRRLSGRESTCQHRKCRFGPWFGKIPWGRKWQPILVFLPGESHGQRSLAGYSPWSCKESEHTLTWLTVVSIHYIPQTYLHYNWKFVPHILIVKLYLIHNVLYISYSPIFYLRKLWIKGIILSGIGISKL